MQVFHEVADICWFPILYCEWGGLTGCFREVIVSHGMAYWTTVYNLGLSDYSVAYKQNNY